MNFMRLVILNHIVFHKFYYWINLMKIILVSYMCQ